MGESGGGGMLVPAVRESRGARTGSSNFPREVLVPLGRVEGISTAALKIDKDFTENDCACAGIRRC